jgi:hypothetical protein
VLLRVWGTYYFDTEFEDQDGSDVGDTLSGSGIGLGIGFTPLPLMSINLGYNQITFDESKDASTGLTSSLSGSNELDFKEITLGVSIPFDL